MPADLTRPSAAYRAQSAMMILGLVLFALFYVGLTAGGNRQLDADTFGQIQLALGDVHGALTDTHRDARRVRTPALTNVPAGTSLLDLLAERSDGPLPELHGDSISGEWINGLANRLGQMLGRVKRVHFKSLGGLLAFQEKLAAEWHASRPPAEPDQLG